MCKLSAHRVFVLEHQVIFLCLILWEPSTGTSHRLPKPVSRKHLDNRVTNGGDTPRGGDVGGSRGRLPQFLKTKCFFI
jgi:hypothetical protein